MKEKCKKTKHIKYTAIYKIKTTKKKKQKLNLYLNYAKEL